MATGKSNWGLISLILFITIVVLSLIGYFLLRPQTNDFYTERNGVSFEVIFVGADGVEITNEEITQQTIVNGVPDVFYLKSRIRVSNTGTAQLSNIRLQESHPIFLTSALQGATPRLPMVAPGEARVLEWETNNSCTSDSQCGTSEKCLVNQCLIDVSNFSGNIDFGATVVGDFFNSEGVLKGNALTIVNLPINFTQAGVTTPVPICGNNIIEGTESCDKFSLANNTCLNINQGFINGTLSCTSTCTWQTNLCNIDAERVIIVKAGDIADFARVNKLPYKHDREIIVPAGDYNLASGLNSFEPYSNTTYTCKPGAVFRRTINEQFFQRNGPATENVTIQGCEFRNEVIADNAMLEFGGGATSIVRNVQILNNNFINEPGFKSGRAMKAGSSDIFNANNVKIMGNKCIHFGSCFFYAGTELKFKNNYLVALPGVDADESEGIDWNRPYSGGVGEISGNEIWNFSEEAIDFSPPNDVLVENNMVYITYSQNTNTRGMQISGGNATVRNNQITFFGDCGMGIYSYQKGGKIYGNTITGTGCQTGIRLQPSARNTEVYGNTLINLKTPIQLMNSSAQNIIGVNTIQ